MWFLMYILYLCKNKFLESYTFLVIIKRAWTRVASQCNRQKGGYKKNVFLVKL